MFGLPRRDRELVLGSEGPSTETTDRRPKVYCVMHCPKTKMVLLSLGLPMRPRDVGLVRETNQEVGLFGRGAVLSGSPPAWIRGRRPTLGSFEGCPKGLSS